MVSGAVHWSLCEKCKVWRSEQWYWHMTEPVTETHKVKILWDINIQTDHVIEHRHPDIVVVKDNKMALLMNITVPGDTRVEEKQQEKIDIYQN